MRGVPVLVVLIVVAGWFGGASAAAGSPAGRPASPVVVIGVAGLLWQDVGAATPALQALAGRAAVAVLSVKATQPVTCPADGWLTLGAGARARAYDIGRQPCTSERPPVSVQDAERNLDTTDEAVLGLLARTLGGVRASGPGAIAATGPVGPLRPAGRPFGSVGPFGWVGHPSVALVDAGVVGGPDRLASLRAADARVAEALAAAGPDANLLVVGLSEGAGGEQARLHVAMATGPAFPPGTLRSASTRRDGYVQLIDVAPTVLDLVGLEVPDEMDGLPWQQSEGRRSTAELADLDVRAVQGKNAVVPFFVVLVSYLVLAPLALRRRPRAARAAAVAGIAAFGMSYAAMLVPWWRASWPLVVLIALVMAGSAAATVLCLRTRNPVGWACGGTVALLVADLLTGAHLQIEAPAGYSSLVAGRFAGIGNVAFGVYGTCALIAAAALAAGRERRKALLVVAAAALIAVAVDGAPAWGSDVGGVLSLLPAFVLLGMLLAGIRVSLVRLALAGLAAVVVVTAFALADYARPASDRTHLGRFVEQVRDGTAGEVLVRKASAIGNLLFDNPVTALLPLVVALVVYLFRRPPGPLADALAAEPAFRCALLAIGLMSVLGFALNDSGPAVVALAVVVVLGASAAVISGVAARPAGAGDR